MCSTIGCSGDDTTGPSSTEAIITAEGTFEDADTGRELVAVYVPTTPNPTSGYLEIVPRENVTSTNWTVDEAMKFIGDGGEDPFFVYLPTNVIHSPWNLPRDGTATWGRERQGPGPRGDQGR